MLKHRRLLLLATLIFIPSIFPSVWADAPIDNAPVGVDPTKLLKGGDGKEVDRVLVEMMGENFKTFSGDVVHTKTYLIAHGCPNF